MTGMFPEGLKPELGLCQFRRNQRKLINNSPKYSLSLKQKPRRGKSSVGMADLFSIFQKEEMDMREGTKDSLDKPGLCIGEWVPCAVTSAKNILFRAVSHGHQ